jgi:hypothetical protein
MNVLSPHIALYRLFDLADEIDLARLGTPRLRLSRPRLGRCASRTPGPAGAGGAERGRGFRPPHRPALRVRGGLPLLPGAPGGEAAVGGLRGKGPGHARASLLGGLFYGGAGRFGALPPRGPPPPRGEAAFRGVRGLPRPGPRGGQGPRPPVDLTPLWMGTREEFAPEVRREMERYRYSYSTEDLALLGFDRVLILDSEGIWDVADLVEFVPRPAPGALLLRPGPHRGAGKGAPGPKGAGPLGATAGFSA